MKIEVSWFYYVGQSLSIFLLPWIGMLGWGMVLHQGTFASTGWELPYISYWQTFWISLLGRTLFSDGAPTRFISKSKS